MNKEYEVAIPNEIGFSNRRNPRLENCEIKYAVFPSERDYHLYEAQRHLLIEQMDKTIIGLREEVDLLRKRFKRAEDEILSKLR